MKIDRLKLLSVAFLLLFSLVVSAQQRRRNGRTSRGCVSDTEGNPRWSDY